MDKVEISFKIDVGVDRYPIHIGSGALKQLPKIIDFSRYSSIVVITDDNLSKHWLAQLEEVLPEKAIAIVLAAGEFHKTIETVQQVWQKLAESESDRRSIILNLGGGVIGDLGGFVASTFMRGLDFVQIPTTLLAQVDASVGGKVGVNFAGVKNLVGSFAPPLAVCIDVDTLATLPLRQYRSGFAEVIKHGLIRDKAYFDLVSARTPDSFGTEDLVRIVRRSCELKAEVVEKDERESGLRKILNFGHTIGHALEALSLSNGTPMLHGEAIGIGMVAEARISVLTKRISEVDLLQIEATLRNYELPTRMPFQLHLSDVLEKIKSDKKNIAGAAKWTLLERIGEASYDCAVDPQIVIDAIGYISHG
ncbi:MAG: 3-dehydroquinate synthase [Bdellovibrionales bacterium]|nr:3-dehydroquinate synthase [Bdellovibrionales bacterium]